MDRLSIRKAKQSQAVRVPITFDQFEVTSTHEIFTAVFRDDCGHTHAVALKACLVVNIEVDNQVSCTIRRPRNDELFWAFAKLEAGDPGAMAAFAAHVGRHADDQLASFHLKRLLNGETSRRIVMD